MEKNWNQEGQGRILKIFDSMESALYIFAVSFMIIVNRSNLQAYSSAGNSNKATTGDIEDEYLHFCLIRSPKQRAKVF